MAAGVIEGIVLKDRRSTYRDGSRVAVRWAFERETHLYTAVSRLPGRVRIVDIPAPTPKRHGGQTR